MSQSLYSFSLPCKAFSANHMYYKNRSIRTADYNAWGTLVLELLEEHKQLHDMADMWRLSGGIWHIRVNVNYPQYLYYNKAKQVSAKTMDVDNVLKPLIDTLFGKFLDVNDRFITVCVSTKGPGATHNIDITLELLSLSKK